MNDAITSLRPSTLEDLGLGSPLSIVRAGRLPVSAEEMVERVFGPADDRGCLVITGAAGIVGTGKTMQLASRLEPFGVRTVALDLPGAPDSLGLAHAGLVGAFGETRARRIAASIVRLTWDGETLPEALAALRPRFLLEAIPEILDLKRRHYAIFREAFPDLEIRSVTSGFPARELGVPIAHPAFPHEVNRIFETVETAESEIPRLLWSLGLQPLPVSDDWSFVLDVLFCGITLAGTRVHRATNLPFWKVDKLVRRMLGPNPFRAHDAIGTKGATYLTWSCLHHLAEHYGGLYDPTPELEERKETGQPFYPPDHFRPVADAEIGADLEEEIRLRMVGPLVQMTSLLLAEDRAHPTALNAIGELCAQLRRGAVAAVRALGADEARRIVSRYHCLEPEAADERSWRPEALDRLDEPSCRQLWVNAEHDGTVGVVSIGRESYNWDVDEELGRALDWLRSEGIERVVLCGDFHLATQWVGADTSDFFPALDDESEGARVAGSWSRTARRLHDDFVSSVALLHGKRCLGGFLELAVHCHRVVAVRGTRLGFPEVTLPVVPGMEGCHWPFRKTDGEGAARLVGLLLGGTPVRAEVAEGWLVDRVADLPEALTTAWAIARGDESGLPERSFEVGDASGALEGLEDPAPTGDPGRDAARLAIWETIRAACGVGVGDALDVQTRLAGRFLASEHCRRGTVGAMKARIERV